MNQPLLPLRWQSSYVSYYRPMRADDRVTNGYAWFDYERGVSRIDGFLNPWDEQAHGHRLWVSEIHWFEKSCRRVRIAYAVTDDEVDARRLDDAETSSTGPALPREILRTGDARPGSVIPLLGREAIPWTIGGPRPTIIYLCARTSMPLRVCIEKEPDHVSVRDFLTIDDRPIPADVFEPVVWAQVER